MNTQSRQAQIRTYRVVGSFVCMHEIGAEMLPLLWQAEKNAAVRSGFNKSISSKCVHAVYDWKNMQVIV